MSDPGLQLGFSTNHADTVYNSSARKEKANKVLSILDDCLGRADRLSLLDIGCSAGFMTSCYCEKFEHVVAVDVDAPAVRYASLHNGRSNISYAVMDAQRLAFHDGAFDVVTCTHIYEHVPDADKLMSEIFRILKPGGACFFSAGNRLSVIEPHYRLPFLSVVPKAVAHRYLRVLGRGTNYYETHLTYWGLLKLVSRFELIDYTRRVVEDPQQYFATDMIMPGSLFQKLISILLRYGYWACPTYLWVLRKPAAK